MTIKNLRFSFILLALCAFAGTAAAQGTGTAPELLMEANVVTAMQLNIVSHASGLEVAGSAGSFSIDFGDIDGLGLAGATADVTVTKSSTGALYLTPINVVPSYSGYVAETATVSVNTVLDVDGLAREGSANNSNATITTSRQAFDGALNNSENVRYVGFFIGRDEAIGAKAATLVYTITMVDEG